MMKPTQMSVSSPWFREMLDEYESRRPQSQKVFAWARKHLPGGQTRSVTHFDPFPVVLDQGHGYMLRDVDGIEYIDVLNNYTSLVHGNAYGPVRSAVSKVLEAGTAFAAIHTGQIDLARNLEDRLASIDVIRFTNSGSEASALAARIARRFTNRDEVVVAEGGYHGAVPPFSDNDSAIVRVPYNDIDALEAVLSERTAAVFLEPFQGAGGVIVGQQAYLQAAEVAARNYGALFVLDEVQSLRNAPGGAQEELGLKPDITLLGKVIGGGFPIGAVSGRGEVLEVTSPYQAQPLAHAGTFNGHLASVTAGAITLDHLDSHNIGSMNYRAQRLANLIERGGGQAGLSISVTRSGSIMNVYRGEAPTNAAEAASDSKFHVALHLALLLEGVYSATRGMLNASTVMSDEVIDEIGHRYAKAFTRIAGIAASKNGDN